MYSLQHLGVQFEDCMAYDSALRFMESTLSTKCWSSSWPGQKKNKKRKFQNVRPHYGTHWMD